MKNNQIGLLQVKKYNNQVKNSMHRSISIFNTAEKIIRELKDRSEENIQNAAQKDKRGRRMEKIRDTVNRGLIYV